MEPKVIKDLLKTAQLLQKKRLEYECVGNQYPRGMYDSNEPEYNQAIPYSLGISEGTIRRCIRKYGKDEIETVLRDNGFNEDEIFFILSNYN